MRLCKCGCGKKLIQRSDENNTHFKSRKFYNQSHANSYTQGEKNRKRVKLVNVRSDSIINSWLSMR